MPGKRKQSRNAEKEELSALEEWMQRMDPKGEALIDVEDVAVWNPASGMEDWQFASSIRECPPLTKTFLERWSAAICVLYNEHASMEEYDDHWESKRVHSDLNRWDTPFSAERYSTNIPLGCLETPDIQLFLAQELHLYWEHLNRVKDVNRALRRVGQKLATVQIAWQETALRVKFSDALKISADLARVRSGLKSFERQYWDRLFCLGQFSIPPQKRGVLYHYKALRPLSPSLQLPSLKQERNLDTLFQVRVADLLLEYCNRSKQRSRVSLRTIARLVVLIYICADLVRLDHDELVIRDSNPVRILSVDKTYETISDAGLRAKSSVTIRTRTKN